MAYSATIRAIVVDVDGNVTVSCDFTDGTSIISRDVLGDVTMSPAAMSAKIVTEGNKLKALLARRTTTSGLTQGGTVNPFEQYVDVVVQIP